MEKKSTQKDLSVELGENEAQGIYSNLALITHSPSEFIIDFARMMPGLPKARIHARIVMTPQHAKNLLRALTENISKYEAQFGAIQVQGPPVTGVSIENIAPEDKNKIH